MICLLLVLNGDLSLPDVRSLSHPLFRLGGLP